MQFGGTAAEQVHQCQEIAVRTTGEKNGLGQLFGEKAFEVIHGKVPDRALVFNVGLENCQGQFLPVGTTKLDGAGDRYGVGKRRLLGEEAANFNFWIAAHLKATVRLEKQPVAEEY